MKGCSLGAAVKEGEGEDEGERVDIVKPLA